jgi:hypothetical protein
VNADERERRLAGIATTTEPEALDLDAVLWEAEAYLRRFVVLTDYQAIAVVLWLAHVFAFDAASTTLYLHVSSAVPRCGKSRLLEVLEAVLGPRCISTSNISPSALYRLVDSRPGTALLIDETDRLLAGSKERAEDLYGLINSGSRRRGGIAYRNAGTGANLTPTGFRTFAPKVIAGLGTLADTVEDRSASIRMQRRLPSEPLERFREANATEAEPMREAFLAWATPEVLDKLRAARPAMPADLNDRAMDAWEPLLGIADLAGGVWPGLARESAVALHAAGSVVAEERLELLALRHVREAFAEHGDPDALPTSAVLEAMVARDDGPWAGWWGEAVRAGGKAALPPARKLARLLQPFGVGSTKVRLGEASVRGYRRADLGEAWERNLGPLPLRTGTDGTTGTPLARHVPVVPGVPVLHGKDETDG